MAQNRTVTYTLRSNTSGVPGLDKFQKSLERILDTQEKLAQQGDVVKGLRDQAAAAVAAAKQEADATRSAMSAKKQAANDYNQLLNQQAAAQEAAAREAVAAARQRAAEAKAQRAASDATTAALRAQSAQIQLTARMAAQAASEEKRRSQEGVLGIENQVRAYRNLWQSRIIGNDQVYQQQARLRQQALEMLATVDKQSDAYRRLTQVAAAAQRTMDASQGVNTPGGFGFGVSQGITGALGQFGVTGDLLAGFVQLFASKRAAARSAATGLGQDAIAGLVSGMKSNQASVKREADLAGDSVAQAIRASLDIHSPSRVTEYLGKMAGLGFVTGVKSMQAEAKAAAAMLANSATAGMTVNGNPAAVTSGAIGANFGAGNIQASASALAELNAQLAASTPASESAGEAVEAAGDAAEGLGESVSGAAEHVKSLRDAHAEEEEASRRAAINEAKTALAFTATAAAISMAVAGLVASYNSAADYQKAMAGAASTTEATADELSRLDDVARSKRLTELGVNAKDAAGGIEELGSQGLSTADIVGGGLVTSLTLAKAVSTDVSKAAAIAAASTKAFGLEAKDLARVGDITTNAVNATSVKIENFSDAIAAGGMQAKASGMSFTEFTAAISFMTDKAIGASDAGTALKTFLMALTPNSKEAAAEMKRLGFNAFDAQGNFKSFSAISENLKSSLSGLTEEQRALAVEVMFGSDGARVALAVAEQGNKGVQERIDLLDRQGTMEEAARKKMEGARGEQEKFNAALENFKITVGSAFLPAGSKMLDWATDFIGKIDEILKKLEKTGDPVEIRRTLTIQAGDDTTTAVLKFILGAGQQVKDTANGVGKFLSDGALHQQLINAGLVERKSYAFGGRAQEIEIGKNRAYWEQVLADYLAKQAQQTIANGEIIKKSIGQGVSGALPPKPLAGQGPLLPGQTRTTDASGLMLVAGLGMTGRTRGTPYNQQYSWGTHVGEDYFAPQGTKVFAPFTGYVKLRQDKAQGNIVDLFDAAGKRLSMIHLQGYADGLKEAVAKAGAQGLLVQRGALLATVGRTGTSAHATADGKNDHLHIHAFNGSQKLDPLNTNFQGVTSGTGWAGIANAPAAATAATKSWADYEKEARRIIGNIKKYASDGTAPNGEKWTAANTALAAFSKTSATAAAAVAWVQSETKKAQGEFSKYGQTFDTLRSKLDVTQSLQNLGRDVAPQLQNIRAAALKAAEAEAKLYGTRNGGTEKYRALLDLAGDAAKRLDAIQSKKPAKPQLTDEQQGQQQIDRERQRADMLLNMRAKSEKQLQDIINGAVTKTNTVDRIHAAEEEVKRRKDVADKATKTAEAEEKAAAQRAAQAQQERNRIIQAGRQQDLQLAEGALAGLRRLREADLKAAGDNAIKRLEVEKRYAADERKALETIAKIRFDIAEKAAKSGPAQLREGALKLANQRLEADMAEAAGLTRVSEANGKVAESVRALRGEYGKLAESLRQKIASGNVEDSDLFAYSDALRDLDAKAKAAGLSQNQFIVGAKASATALIGVAVSAQQAADSTDYLHRAAVKAAASTDVMVSSIDDVVDGLPEAKEQQEWYIEGIEALEQAGAVAAGSVAALRGRIKELAQEEKDAAEVAQNQAAAWDKRIAEVTELAGAYGELGDTDTQLAQLQSVLQDLYTAMDDGENVAAQIDKVTEAIDRLVAATELDDQFNSFVAQLGGTIDDQITQVVDQMASTTDVKLKLKLNRLLADLRGQLSQWDNSAYSNGLIPGANGFQGQSSNGTAVLSAISLRDKLLGMGTTGEGDGIFKPDIEGLLAGIADAKDFLASGVADSLPQGIRDGLQAAIDDAENFASILGDDLGTEVEDAVSRGLKRAAGQGGEQPENVFTAKVDQIYAMKAGGELDDPVKLKAFQEGLQRLREIGQLTDYDLQNLNATIELLAKGPEVNIGKRFDLQREQQAFQSLVQMFDDDQITAQQFNDTLKEGVIYLEDLAKEADAAGNPRLAKQFLDLSKSLKEATPEAIALAKAMEKVGTITQDVGKWGKVASDTATMFGGDTAGKAIQYATNYATGGLNIFMDFLSGNWVKMAQDIVAWFDNIGKAIDDLDPSIRAWKKNLAEMIELNKKALGLDTGGFKSPWQDILEKNAAAAEKLNNSTFLQRLGWSIFGGAPEVISTEASKTLSELQTIFAGFSSGLANIFSSSMESAFDAGKMEDWAKTFSDDFDQLVGKLILRTMIKAAIETGAVAQDLADLTKAVQEQRYDDIPPIMERIKTHANAAMTPIAALAPSLPGYGTGSKTPPKGSIADLDAQISDLQDKKSKSTDPAERQRLQGQIDTLQMQRDQMDGKAAGPTAATSRQRRELLYQYENATDPKEKADYQKKLLALDGPGSGTGPSIAVITREAAGPDWGALTKGVTRLADATAQADQIARMEAETARLNRESAGILAQAAGMILLAAQGGSKGGGGPGNLNF